MIVGQACQIHWIKWLGDGSVHQTHATGRLKTLPTTELSSQIGLFNLRVVEQGL